MDKFIQLLQARAVAILKREKWGNNDIATLLNIDLRDIYYLRTKYSLLKEKMQRQRENFE